MEIFNLINSMAPFLLLGFLLAGLMHVFIPGSLYQRHFGKSNFKSVLYATLLAIPLPLCSCGVIPTAMSLRREGASRGAVISFLIATPQTGVDSILATYSMMGLPFAVLRPIAALATALFGGQLANVIERKTTLGEHHDAAAPHPNNATDELPHGLVNKLKGALKYAYLDMMEDIGKWLAVGLVIAGLITIYVPDEFFQQFAGNTPLSILIVLLFAIPMYLCATGSIPIAIALMLKGLTPGAALVLLMAGPAVNVASMLVIQRVMGTRTLLIYIGSIVGGSILFALGVDYLLPRDLFLNPLMENSSCAHGGISIFQWICTGILALLLLNAFFHRYFGSRHCSCTTGACPAETPHTTTGGNVIYINGMKCNHCKANVEKVLSQVEGLQEARVELSESCAYLQGNFDPEAVIAAVEAIGFQIDREKSTLHSSSCRQLLHIEGMKCNHCKANVEKVLYTVAGVRLVDIDLAAGTATVSGNFDRKAAVEAVESIGFKVFPQQEASFPAPSQTFHIDGMKCNHCKANAEKAIRSVAGVQQVDIDLAAGTAIVRGDFKAEQIVAAIESIGFKVR